MRPWVTFVLAFTAFAVAQSGSNVIDNGASGIQATAGKSLTLTWTNPSAGTVTIKIQTSGNVQPGDGIVLASNVQNTGSATVQIPGDVPAGQIYIQIVDDKNPSDSNFSGGFQAAGATNTAPVAASTGSAVSASKASSAAASSSSDASASSASESSASESSASESSASASASSASESSASSSRASTSRTAASATASQTTAPTGAAAMPVVQGGLMAAMLGAAVLL